MTRSELEALWARVGQGVLTLEPLIDRLAELVIAGAPREQTLAALHALDARFGSVAESAHQLGDLKTPRAAKAPLTEAQGFARRRLLAALDRIESTKDLGVLAFEVRELIPQIRAGNLDGALTRRALVSAAETAGLASDDVERVIANQTRAA